MNKRDPKLTALLFNEKINNQDLKALSDLMTEDHENSRAEPKKEMVKAWEGFFKAYPDYKNFFDVVIQKRIKLL